MHVQQLTLSQILSRIQDIIDSGGGDAGRLFYIMEFLKNRRPLYRSDSAYLEKKLGSSFSLVRQPEPAGENPVLPRVQGLIDSGTGDPPRLLYIYNMLKNRRPLYRSDRAYLEKKLSSAAAPPGRPRHGPLEHGPAPRNTAPGQPAPGTPPPGALQKGTDPQDGGAPPARGQKPAGPGEAGPSGQRTPAKKSQSTAPKNSWVMKRNYLDIIDPIHDFIRVYDHELEIIDSPVFQRLRRIRQLSGAHLTYPAAQHTRFEHSLGVMHIAGQAGGALAEKGVLGPDDIKTLRLAGLLHDVGHGPFSHLFEEIISQKKFSHEDLGKEIILNSDIGDILSKNGFDKGLIAGVAFGESKHQYLNEIISGALSADVMDYLQRDGYFTGAEHAKIDHKRLTQSLEVYQGKLALERSALYSFESMMHSRYQMFKAVYFHKTVRAAEVMLLEALRLSDDEFGFTSFDIDEYVKLTDEYVLSQLVSPGGSAALRRARGFAEDYQNRRLLKCVYERILTARTSLGKVRTAELRKSISEKSRIDESEIFVDSSATPSIPLAPSKNESKSIVLVTNDGSRHSVSEMPISEIPAVSAISGFMNILRIYTHQKHRNKVEIAAKSVVGGLE